MSQQLVILLIKSEFRSFSFRSHFQIQLTESSLFYCFFFNYDEQKILCEKQTNGRLCLNTILNKWYFL